MRNFITKRLGEKNIHIPFIFKKLAANTENCFINKGIEFTQQSTVEAYKKLKELKQTPCIFFCLSKKQVESIALELCKSEGFETTPCTSTITSNETMQDIFL